MMTTLEHFTSVLGGIILKIEYLKWLSYTDCLIFENMFSNILLLLVVNCAQVLLNSIPVGERLF